MNTLMVLIALAPLLCQIAMAVAALRAANEYVRRGRVAQSQTKSFSKRVKEALVALLSK